VTVRLFNNEEEGGRKKEIIEKLWFLTSWVFFAQKQNEERKKLQNVDVSVLTGLPSTSYYLGGYKTIIYLYAH